MVCRRSIIILLSAPAATSTEWMVLIRGYSGTDKEYIAESIHCYSNHRHKPYTALNCAVLLEAVLKNKQLFRADQLCGKLTEASGRNLILNEVAKMSFSAFFERLNERTISNNAFEASLTLFCITKTNIRPMLGVSYYDKHILYGIISHKNVVRSK